MNPAAALVALYCVAAAPAPLVGADVYRALRGEPVPAAATRQAVADAVKGAARNHHSKGHGR